MSATIAAPTRQVTRAEYQALPEGPPYYELIDGELIEMSPRPVRAHYLLAGILHANLYLHTRPQRGHLALEPNLYLPGTEDVYEPDLAYVAAHRRRAICRKNGLHGVPDMVCEILSPSTAYRDRGVKLEAYRRAGVGHLWLIEPETLLVEEYVLAEEDRYRLQTVATPPAVWSPLAFPGWSLDLAAALAEITEDDLDDSSEEEPR
jgi:Uma2 family endonuclease